MYLIQLSIYQDDQNPFPLDMNVINYVNKLSSEELLKNSLEVLSYSYNAWLDLLTFNTFAFIHKCDSSVTWFMFELISWNSVSFKHCYMAGNFFHYLFLIILVISKFCS